MSATTLRILIAVFLIAHGLVHVSLTYVPVPEPGALRTPYWPSWWRANIDSAWPASRLGLPPAQVRTTGWILWIAALLGFAAAGLGLAGVPWLNSIWTGFAVAGSAASLLLLGFYWHPWLVMGVAIDLAVAACLWLRWPLVVFPPR